MKNYHKVIITLFLLLIFSSCKKTANKEKTHNEELMSFDYKPIKPVDGKLYGVIELGAAGFNSFIGNSEK